VAGGSFENSRTQYSLESLSQPAALLSGETVLWYNSRFRTALLGGEDRLAGRAQKLLPGLDTAQARTPEGQQLNLADGVWNVHSSTVPGGSESMTLLVFNEETALRRIETEYKASRPGYMVFLVDGYDDVFSDVLDSEQRPPAGGHQPGAGGYDRPGHGLSAPRCQRPLYRRGGRAPSGAVCPARLRCAG